MTRSCGHDDYDMLCETCVEELMNGEDTDFEGGSSCAVFVDKLRWKF